MTTSTTVHDNGPEAEMGGDVDGISLPTKRDVAALTRCMTVLPNVGRARDAPGLFVVVSDSGKQYLVDAVGGACECPDNNYRDRECKHINRVRYATGEYEIPEWANEDAVDDLLGRHVTEADR